MVIGVTGDRETKEVFERLGLSTQAERDNFNKWYDTGEKKEVSQKIILDTVSKIK